MRSAIFSLISILFLPVTLAAQESRMVFSLNAELAVPALQPEWGWGCSVEGYRRINHSGGLTLSAGFSLFSDKDPITKTNTHTRLIPVLLGYRFYKGYWFIQPQAGLGEMGGRIELNGDFSRPSVTSFLGSLQAGRKFSRWQAGFRWLYARGIGRPDAGLWHNREFHYGSLFAGWRL